MNQKVTKLISEITGVRQDKYQKEVERQKAFIEEALVKFFQETKTRFENIEKANITHQGQNYLWFELKLDVSVLPEVAEYISAEFDLKVDEDDKRKVFGQYYA